MLKPELKILLNESFEKVQSWYQTKSSEHFEFKPSADKWTSGQHALHLLMASSAFEKGLKMNKWILRYKFGTNNRDERDFQETKDRYYERVKLASPEFLKNNPFSPSEVKAFEREIILTKLKEKSEKINRRLDRWNEKQLSTIIVPHPAMGKLTMREMCYFIAFHNDHHVDILNKIY